MNRSTHLDVRLSEPSYRFSPSCLLVLFISLVTLGCFSDEQGAAEVSWALRTFSEQSPPPDLCSRSNIESIRLCWNALDPDSELLDLSCTTSFRDYPCENQNGSTNFEIPTGRVGFWLVPICQQSGQLIPAEEGTFRSPPAVIRDVAAGRIVSLQSHLIEVTDPDDDCGPLGCTCDPN